MDASRNRMWPILALIFLRIHISDGLSLGFVSWRSPRVILTDVSVSYPDSFWRKLTSSVPRRDFALQDIHWTLESGVLYLVTGDSSAGKSTLLRLIQGVESPTNGSVQRLVVTSSSQDDGDGPEFSRSQAPPVYLDNTKPAYSQDNYIQDIWNSPHDGDNRLTASQWESYRNVLSVVFEISCDAQVCDLTTSQLYLCQLGQACLQSCVPLDHDSNVATKGVCLEAPIILLDEWLDKETSQVIHKVQQALQVFIEQTGAIAICVTHKPERFLLSSQSSNPYYGDLCRVVMGQGNIRSIRRGDQ